jgi:hypothetical protein
MSKYPLSLEERRNLVVLEEEHHKGTPGMQNYTRNRRLTEWRYFVDIPDHIDPNCGLIPMGKSLPDN